VTTFTRSLGFRCAGDHWESDSAYLCGFVPMPGIGQAPLRRLPLADPDGGHVTLRFGDETKPENPGHGLSASGMRAWRSQPPSKTLEEVPVGMRTQDTTVVPTDQI
jgi:hypothetical protein